MQALSNAIPWKWRTKSQPWNLQVRHFPGPAFSSPCDLVLHFPGLANSRGAIWSVIFQVLQFPVIVFCGPTFSGPANSAPPAHALYRAYTGGRTARRSPNVYAYTVIACHADGRRRRRHLIDAAAAEKNRSARRRRRSKSPRTPPPKEWRRRRALAQAHQLIITRRYLNDWNFVSYNATRRNCDAVTLRCCEHNNHQVHIIANLKIKVGLYNNGLLYEPQISP